MYRVLYCDVNICDHNIANDEDNDQKEREEYENARNDIDDNHVGIEVAIYDYDLASIGGIPEVLRGYDTEPLIEGKPKPLIHEVSRFSAKCLKLHDMTVIQFVTLMTPIFRRDWDFYILHRGWWISSMGFYDMASTSPMSQAQWYKEKLDRGNAWVLAVEKDRNQTPTDQAANEK